MATKLTQTGVQKIIANLFGTALTAPTYLGWGTGTTAPAVTDTALQTASAEARTNGTASKITTTFTNDTLKVVGTITSASGQTISEVGLFDASTAGNMYIHGVFTGVVLSTGDAIQFTATIQITTT
jgi:hypothetical protein